MMARNIFLLLWIYLVCPPSWQVQGGLEIKKKERFISVPQDPNAGNAEIYTSMLDLENFFKEELEYVEDLRALYDKKLIS